MTRPAPALLAEAPAPAWQPDQGDGTFRNPVLYADYSDPDAIRVGDDYWLTSSSFGHVPGLPILHSRDLVNWTLVNHALPALTPVEHFRQPRHGQGVWAPALRYQAGRYWIFYPDPDFGIYVVHAEDPRGTWSAPIPLKMGRGLIDPCPFWDDDGAAYLVHGWARSRSGISNLLTLHRFDPAELTLLDDGHVIIDGARLPGWHTIEGPKLYKRNGYYYVFAPAGGVADGYQAVFRARDIRGPYENRVVLHQGATPVNGPHQGAWVDTPRGEHWFLHFQEMPAYGRVVHLQPLRWVDDWPVIGDDADGDGTGEPVLVHRKPALPPARPAVPATSDEFDGPAVGRQWQWQANPSPDWASLLPATGGLRLRCVPHDSAATLWTAGHLLLQKFPAPTFTATTVLRLHATAEAEAAGLVVFGYTYAWLGLRRESGRVRLVLNQCVDAQRGNPEVTLLRLDPDADRIVLQVSVEAGGGCRFAYGRPGGELVTVGPVVAATSSHWVGAKVGLFASAADGAGTAAGPGAARGGAAGWAEFGWFRVTPPVARTLDGPRARER